MFSQQAADAVGFRTNKAFKRFIDGMHVAHVLGKCRRSIKFNGANFTEQQLLVIRFVVYGILWDFIASAVMPGRFSIYSLMKWIKRKMIEFVVAALHIFD